MTKNNFLYWSLYMEQLAWLFRSDLKDHNENKAFPPVLCYPSHWLSYSYLSAVIFWLQNCYFNFLTSFFVRFFLFRLIFRFKKNCNFSDFIQLPLVCIYGETKLTYLLTYLLKDLNVVLLYCWCFLSLYQFFNLYHGT